MTEQQHPITPSPELVQQWHDDNRHLPSGLFALGIATQAARWGSDQELEACCEWFQEFYKTESWVEHDLKHFRAARRPKPPSLKEQGLALIDKIQGNKEMWQTEELNVIRHALELLQD